MSGDAALNFSVDATCLNLAEEKLGEGGVIAPDGLSTVEQRGRTQVAIIGGTGYVGRLLARCVVRRAALLTHLPTRTQQPFRGTFVFFHTSRFSRARRRQAAALSPDTVPRPDRRLEPIGGPAVQGRVGGEGGGADEELRLAALDRYGVSDRARRHQGRFARRTRRGP
eukprot:284455-Prymnesium_polylepis.1